VKKNSLFIDFIFLITLLIIKIIKIFIPLRLNRSYSSRLGHFVGINTLYIYKKNRNYFDFFILDKEISSTELYFFLKNKIFFIPKIFSTFFHKILNTNLKYKLIKNLSFHYDENFNLKREIFECRDRLNLIDKTNIKFDYNEEKAKNIIHKNKIKFNTKKIICIQIRDKGYLNKNFQNYNDHKLVNANISKYTKTIKKLISLGYTVVRVGRDHENFLQYQNKNYIDLHKNGQWNSELELFLIYKCIFFIGTHSGGSMIPIYLFKKPTLLTNFLPIGKLFSYSKNTMFIPKKLKIKNKLLNLNEIFNKNLSIFEKKNNLIKNKVKILDNSSQEIYLATLDMLNFLKDKKDFIKKNNKQLLKFKKNFKKYVSESKLLAYHGKINANISPSFLKKNKFFLC